MEQITFKFENLLEKNKATPNAPQTYVIGHVVKDDLAYSTIEYCFMCAGESSVIGPIPLRNLKNEAVNILTYHEPLTIIMQNTLGKNEINENECFAICNGKALIINRETSLYEIYLSFRQIKN